MVMNRNFIYCFLLVLSFSLPILKGGLGLDIVWFISFSFLIAILLVLKDFVINLKHLCFFLVIALSSLFSVYLNDFSYFLFFKSYAPVVIIWFISYSIFHKYGIEVFFKVYLTVCFYLSIFGIIQFISSIIGIDILLNVSGRLNSTFPEGSHFAAAIAPAVVYLVLRKVYNIEAVIIYIAYFLTFSTTSYFVALLMLVAYKFSFRRIGNIFSILLLVGLSFLCYYFINDVSYRVNDLIDSFNNYDLTSVNLTTFSFYSNLEVAISSLTRHFPFGAGMGNHYLEYQYFIDYINADFRSLRSVGINQESGHSLFIRILSEFGIVGFLCVVLYFSFLFLKVFLNGSDRSSEEILIAYSCSAAVVFRFFKLGGYIDYGLIIFICCTMIALHQNKGKTCL